MNIRWTLILSVWPHFIAERNGVIRLSLNGVLQATPFLDISSRVSTSGEGGS